MQREDVTKIFEGATDEQINAILNLNSADISEKERIAQEEKAKAARDADILSRFTEATKSKDGKAQEWTHEAVRADYLRKFTEALSDKANEGLSDADILHMLTKDDAGAFKGVTARVVLAGAKPMAGDTAMDMRDAFGLVR